MCALWKRLLLLCVCVASTGYSVDEVPVVPPRKESRDPWSRFELNESPVKEFLTTDNCHGNSVMLGENVFLICIEAINAMLMFSNPPLSLVPDFAGSPPLQESVRVGNALLIQKEKVDLTLSDAVLYNMQIEKSKKLRELWAQYHLALAGNPAMKKIDFTAVYEWITKNLYTPDNKTPVLAHAYNTVMSRTFDRHSGIFVNLGLRDTEELVGVGVYLKEIFGRVKVARLVKGGPADEAGLMKDDLLLKVGEHEVLGQSSLNISELLSGSENSKVVVVVKRGQETLSVEVTRRKIEYKDVSGSILRGAPQDVGHIYIENFYNPGVCERFESLVQDQIALGAKGIILDLRDNPGGLKEEAQCLLDLFVESGRILFKQRGLGVLPVTQASAYMATARSKIDIPLVVLVNAESASAAELVSGSLQGNKRALVLGERTFGKGTIQKVGPFHSSDEIFERNTNGHYLVPDRDGTFFSPQYRGIVPDITVPTTPSGKDEERFALREENYDWDLVTKSPEAVVLPQSPSWREKIRGLSAEELKARDFQLAVALRAFGS